MKRWYTLFLLLFFSFENFSQSLLPSTIGEVYNFEVGDSFQYYNSYYNYLGYRNTTATGYSTRIILERIDSANTRIYKVQASHFYTVVTSNHGSINFSMDTVIELITNLDSSIFFNHDSNISCYSTASYCHADSSYIDNEYCGRKGNVHFNGTYAWAYQYYKFADGVGNIESGSFSEDYQVPQGSSYMTYYKKTNAETCGNFSPYPVVNSLEKSSEFSRIKLVPNPASTNFQLQFQQFPPIMPYFRLFDALGREIKQARIISPATTLTRDNLSNGIYFWVVESEGKILDMGKIVFE